MLPGLGQNLPRPIERCEIHPWFGKQSGDQYQSSRIVAFAQRWFETPNQYKASFDGLFERFNQTVQEFNLIESDKKGESENGD